MHLPKLRRPVQIFVGTVSICIVGAAGPIDNALAPLSPPAYAEPAPAVKTLTARGASFQEAPMPDQDVAAPADRSKPDATISPKLLSPRSLFQGDGYSYASSEQSTLDGRRAAAAGLGLSVPVK
jgi:hypothetical protein